VPPRGVATTSRGPIGGAIGANPETLPGLRRQHAPESSTPVFLSLKADAGDCVRAFHRFVALAVAVGGVANAWKIADAGWGGDAIVIDSVTLSSGFLVFSVS